MKRIILLASLCACATNEANLGSTEHETPRWAIGLGDRGYESTTAVAFDSLGDVVVAGQGHLWPADLGNGTIGSYEDWGFLTKRVASDGSSRWSIAYPGYGQYAGAFISALAIGADDSIFISGVYNGTVHFGDHVLANGNAFIAKYSTDGDLQWIWTPETPGAFMIRQIALDPAGNIVAAGQYGGVAIDLLGQHHAAQPNGNGFVLSFDPSGAPQWGTFLTDPDGASIESLALTSSGDVIVSGNFQGATSFGGAVLDAGNARSRGFIARYRGDGLYLWSHTFGIDGGVTGDTRLAVVHDDHVAMTDVEVSDSDWRDNTARITELDGDGLPVWTTTNTYAESVRSASLAVRPDGDLVSATWQEIDGPDPIRGHVQITTFDPTGHSTQGAVGSRVSPDYRGTASVASATGRHGELAVVGEFAGSIDLGFGPLVTHGTDDTDAFVLVVEPPAP